MIHSSRSRFLLITESCTCPPYPPEFFDRVLLDAPCSGLGQRPSAVNNVSLAEATSYPPLQKRLLEKVQCLLPFCVNFQHDSWLFLRLFWMNVDGYVYVWFV